MNGIKLFVIGLILMTFAKIAFCQTVKDIDGNIYKTVKIGNQIWMAEDLRVTHYQNGDPIQQQTSSQLRYADSRTGLWCFDAFNPNNCKCYNWYSVVDPRGIAPSGWHIPTQSEWFELLNYTGLGSEGSKKLKSTQGWESAKLGGYYEEIPCPNCRSWNAEYRSKVPCHACQDTRKVQGNYVEEYEIDLNGTNSTGFNGKPNAEMVYSRMDNLIITMSKYGYIDATWWSTTESTFNRNGYGYTEAYSASLNAHNVKRSDKGSFIAVRCIKD